MLKVMKCGVVCAGLAAALGWVRCSRAAESMEDVRLGQERLASTDPRPADSCGPAEIGRAEPIISGDLRVRHESANRNAAFGEDDVDRARIRARVGIDTKLGERWELGLRFATGAKATSANQDLGALSQDPDTLEYEDAPVELYVDRAFARFRGGGDRRLELLAGRMPNPYLFSPILWDNDFNPDGLAETFIVRGASTEFFVRAGQHILGRRADRNYGPCVYGLQPGVCLKGDSASVTAAAAYYAFARAGGVHDVPAGGDYAIADLYVCAAMKTAGGLPVSAWLDCLANLDAESDGSAYGTGVCVGSAKAKGEVAVKLVYVSIERDAVWIDLGEGDFSGGLAREDMHGFALGVAACVGKGVTFAACWYHNEARYSEAREDVLKIDLVLRF